MSAATNTTRNYVTVVTGLPRSGTSMMMRMLEAGGLPVLADNIRAADDDNLRGYYEFEPVKRTKQDPSWLESATGKAVKMVYRLLYDLPGHYQYRVLIMRRKMTEILVSQRKMLQRQGRQDSIPDEKIERLYTDDMVRFTQWIGQHQRFQAIEVDYNRLMEDPTDQLARVNSLLDGNLLVAAMRAVVEPSLYRNRS